MDPKELIAALGVLADPNASDEDKAAALDKLSAYFNSLLDDAEGGASEKTEGSSEATDEESKKDETESKEKDSESGEAKDDESEKDSALTAALATVEELKSRMAKLEKASAIGAKPRAAKPTIIAREAPVEQPKDPVVSMIEAAERNTLRNLSK